MTLRKILLSCCLAVFCLGALVGCEKPAGKDPGPTKKAPAQTTAPKTTPAK